MLNVELTYPVTPENHHSNVSSDPNNPKKKASSRSSSQQLLARMLVKSALALLSPSVTRPLTPVAPIGSAHDQDELSGSPNDTGARAKIASEEESKEDKAYNTQLEKHEDMIGFEEGFKGVKQLCSFFNGQPGNQSLSLSLSYPPL